MSWAPLARQLSETVYFGLLSSPVPRVWAQVAGQVTGIQVSGLASKLLTAQNIIGVRGSQKFSQLPCWHSKDRKKGRKKNINKQREWERCEIENTAVCTYFYSFQCLLKPALYKDVFPALLRRHIHLPGIDRPGSGQKNRAKAKL